jgi:phosphoribosylanthranilate isomerase
VDAVLVDGPSPGSGVAHSFGALTERTFGRPVIAAGGLTPLSVVAVIDAYDVWGVDVASGVESSPGVKDPDRVAEFVDAARRAFAARAAR